MYVYVVIKSSLQSAPALPPKLVYAELQQLDKVPKSMNTNKHVSYSETFKTE